LSEEISPDQHTTKLWNVFHEKLDALKNLSYLIDMEDDLQMAIKSIEDIHHKLSISCPKQNGIPLRSSPVKKKLKINKTEYHQIFHKSLPKRKKWKRSSPVRIVIDNDETVLETKNRGENHNKSIVSI
jgi:hypothetical protein